MKRRRVLLAAVAITLVVGVCGVAYLADRTRETIGDAYTGEWVAGLVIEHMESRGGAWPRGWEDLRGPYETRAERAGRPWSFEVLRGRVDVDWGADPAQLADAPAGGPGPPFRVIRLRSGRDTHWDGREPNRMILDYLRERRARG